MSCDDWRAYLKATQPESSRKAIRDSTFSGRPLGSAEFTRALERQEHRPLIKQKPGPKKRSEAVQERPISPSKAPLIAYQSHSTRSMTEPLKCV